MYMGNPMLNKRLALITRQEQILAEAQKKLERAERLREEMVKQVEAEMKRLEEMRDIAENASNFTQGGTWPNLSTASPASFESQYDQFSTTGSNSRLTSGNTQTKPLDIDILQTPQNDGPTYSHSERGNKWTHLNEYPPEETVYISGRYISTTRSRTPIDSSKQYEYKLSTHAVPLAVGDQMIVPVHKSLHRNGRPDERMLILKVEEIYSNQRFNEYHDIATQKVMG